MVYPCEVFHELLVADCPSQRGRRKRSPFVVVTEASAAFAANAHQNIISVTIAIAQSAEESYQLAVFGVASHACLAIFQVASHTKIAPLIEVAHEVGVVGIKAFILVILITITQQRFHAVAPPLVLIGRCKLEIVGTAIGIGVIGIARGIVHHLSIILRRVVSLVVSVVPIGRKHEVGLPSFNWLKGDIAGQSGVFGLVFAGVFVEQFHRVHIIVDGGILVPTAVLVLDWLRGIAHNSLPIDLGSGRIDGPVLMPPLLNIKRQLDQIIESPM